MHANAVTGLTLSKRALASLSLYHHILVALQKRKRGPMLLGPVFRLLANAEGARGKRYLSEDQCGKDVELTANRMPAYWRRMQDSVEQPVEDLALAIASPPVMCWICGEGFLHNGALFKHCGLAHGDYAEYRKRLFWRVQKDGFKPLLPWVKRHMLESATFHLTYSVPGSFSLKWSHPEAFDVARQRSEVACVVCARQDWLECRFTVYLWRDADGSKTLAELQHDTSGSTVLLTNGEHLCFGNRELINKLLNIPKYNGIMPSIPQEHLYASSVIHPADESMSWLLHSRRVPMLANSRTVLNSLSQSEQSSGSAAQPASSQFNCAGVGDKDAVAWICYDCATCLCVLDKYVKMPEYALSNKMFLGREHPLLQNGSIGLHLLLGLGRPCFRKLLLGRGRHGDREAGSTGNHILVAQGAPKPGEELPPSSKTLSAHFVTILGQNPQDISKCQLLTVNREAYRTLVEERKRVNPTFAYIDIKSAVVDALPENGVPAQLAECAVEMPESDRYTATCSGPGSIRDPLDKAAPEDDASDELNDEADGNDDGQHVDEDTSAQQTKPDSAAQSVNQFETPLGLDPSATPDFVQHLGAFKAQLELVQEALQRSRVVSDSAAQPVGVDVSAATARAASEEDCYRAIVDLREAAQKLNQHDFQQKLKLLDQAANKALHVKSGGPLSMFDPPTWTKCFAQFWLSPNLIYEILWVIIHEIFLQNISWPNPFLWS